MFFGHFSFGDELYLTVVTLTIVEYRCFRQDLRKPIIFRDGIKMTSSNQQSMKRVKKTKFGVYYRIALRKLFHLYSLLTLTTRTQESFVCVSDIF